MIVDAIRGLLVDVIGHGAEHRYLAMTGSLALFIFIGNLFGLIFPLQPPTGSLSTTAALAVIAFLYFNWQGIKEQGLLRYLRHFAGPSLRAGLDRLSHAQNRTRGWYRRRNCRCPVNALRLRRV